MDNENQKSVGLRLIDSSEVIGFEEKGIDGLPRFSQLLKVMVHPNGQATMIPFVDIESFDEKVTIKEDHIILRYKPMGTVWSQHEGLVKALKQRKTGIITPNTSLKL